MSCNCECKPTTVHTPNPCHTPQSTTHSVRLYTLKCGSWVYAGQMPMNSAPTRGMRLLWEGKAYTIEQSTLTGSEPSCHNACVSQPTLGSRAGGTDKWEVMLIQAGPGYATTGCNSTPHNPCIPCPPSTLPPIEPTPGKDHDSPCTDQWYAPPTQPPETTPWGHNTPRPVEIGLGCGAHYQCTGYPS